MARRFLSTSGSKQTQAEAELLARARPHRVGRLAAWQWGEGPLVLLAHGWEGRGGQLGAFVAPLVDAGFSVVAFDAPGHGLSPGGTATIADFARALFAMKRRFGTPRAVIAHSLGSVGALLAQRQGLGAEALVVIAPPSPSAAFGRFGEALALPDAVSAGARRRIEAAVGLPFAAVEPAALAVGLEGRLLVVHDVADKESAFSVAERLRDSVPGSELHRTSGLGHRRIVRDAEVDRRATGFLLAGTPAARVRPAA